MNRKERHFGCVGIHHLPVKTFQKKLAAQGPGGPGCPCVVAHSWCMVARESRAQACTRTSGLQSTRSVESPGCCGSEQTRGQSRGPLARMCGVRWGGATTAVRCLVRALGFWAWKSHHLTPSFHWGSYPSEVPPLQIPIQERQRMEKESLLPKSFKDLLRLK